MVKSKVPIDIQLAQFRAYKDELYVGKRVKPSTDKVFQTLSQKLGMTPAALRISVVRNTGKVLAACDEVQAELNDVDVSLTECNNNFFNQSTEGDSAVLANSELTDQSINSELADQSINSANGDAKCHSSSLNESQSLHSDESNIEENNKPVRVKRISVSFAAEVNSNDIFGVSYKIQGKKIV